MVNKPLEQKAARAINQLAAPWGLEDWQLLRQQAALLEPDLDEPPRDAEIHRQQRDHLL
jgi:hypothetical protein